jgi:16S rRNA (cytidine1402-2'-O)-methyltransferase
MQSFHDYNERGLVPEILNQLGQGKKIALISDAGTPLISDPGFQLVSRAIAGGLKVVPVPGPSAIITALSVAGLPTNRFVFEGFVPEQRNARQKLLKSLAYETRTIVLFETPHRIVAFLEAAVSAFGLDREAVLARELTKKFETIYRAPLGELLEQMQGGESVKKGEFVVLISGYQGQQSMDEIESARILEILLAHDLPVKAVAAITAEITGAKKNMLYKQALRLQKVGAGTSETE